MIYKKEIKWLGDFLFGIKLSLRKKNNWFEFQTDLTKCTSTTPISLFTVLKCHNRDMSKKGAVFANNPVLGTEMAGFMGKRLKWNRINQNY